MKTSVSRGWISASLLLFAGFLIGSGLAGCGSKSVSTSDAKTQYQAATPQQKAQMAVSAPIPAAQRIQQINAIPGLSDADKAKYTSQVH